MYYIKKYNLEAIFLRREVSQEMMEMFITKLYSDEKSENKISKYQHDIRQFFEFSKGKEICKVLVMEYKAFLSSKYAVSSVNSMLAALNSFLKFCDWDDCCVKPFKVQKRIFCSEEQELTKAEYVRLVETAKKVEMKECILYYRQFAEREYESANYSILLWKPLEMVRRLLIVKGKQE